jgi:hypothetical protein
LHKDSCSCRMRHEQDYAACQIMPNTVGERIRGGGFMDAPSA